MPSGNSHRDFKADAFQPVAKGLGLVALSWNDLLVSLSNLLAGIFETSLKVQNKMISDTIWHAISSDRDQIKILNELASSRALGIKIPNNIREQIDWVTVNAIKLLDARNDLLHTPFVNSYGQIGPLHLGMHRRGLKYASYHAESRDVLEDYEWFYQAATTLRDWADTLDEALRRSDFALPKRPKWNDRPIRKKAGSRK